MADIYMHSKLAEKVINKIDYNFNRKIVFLAAQGPDPLYYNFFSKNHPEYRKYANLMHRKDTDKFFINMVNYVKDNLEKDTYSFLVGFICHYCLDLKIHPYVYHNVGVFKKDDPTTFSNRGLHLKFERSIDALLIEKDLGIKHRRIKLIKKHYPLNTATFPTMKIMDYAIKETYGKEHGGVMYLISSQKMYWNLKHFIYDRFGIKKLIFKFIDLFKKNHDMMYADIPFYNHLENYDFHNMEKKTWYHPVTNEEYNYSVIDLFDQANEMASNIIKEVSLYLFEDKTIDLNKLFTNLSYNTGLDCDQVEPYKYFNIYRK
ncbi:MAG: zinc dependent phospholipase C family protein [Candidatus Izimaplasma sp.]|nr:zinc dependent phospholipase C family protein [Candidatus Izimaplasma bacterium]